MPWPGLTSNTPCGRSSVTVARPRGASTRFRSTTCRSEYAPLTGGVNGEPLQRCNTRLSGRTLDADFFGDKEG
jgi:hypothetical protein